MTGFSEQEAKAADAIIAHIDDDGYLKVPLNQIAEEEQLVGQLKVVLGLWPSLA